MKDKILVTGGAGFIGSHVVDELIEYDENVLVLDDLSGGFVENVNPQAEFIEGSITDKDCVEKIFKEHKITYIFHLAAYAAEGLSHFIKRFNYENNLIGSINLINAAINHSSKCFVFTSSIAVYGKNQLPMSEEMIPLPEDSYGIAKLAVERELEISRSMFGLEYIIFRPHNVYGERQNIGDKYRNVVGIFMNQIMQGNPLTIFGDGEQTRAFSYIKDVSPLIAQSIYKEETYNQIFNVGADTPYTVNELAEKVCCAFGVSVKKNHLEERLEVKHAFSSHGRAKRFFDYRSEYSLDTGIANMTRWAKKAGARESKKFDDVEVLKDLPFGWKENMERVSVSNR